MYLDGGHSGSSVLDTSSLITKPSETDLDEAVARLELESYNKGDIYISECV